MFHEQLKPEGEHFIAAPGLNGEWKWINIERGPAIICHEIRPGGLDIHTYVAQFNYGYFYARMECFERQRIPLYDGSDELARGDGMDDVVILYRQIGPPDPAMLGIGSYKRYEVDDDEDN